VRGHCHAARVTARAARDWQLTYDVSVEVKGRKSLRSRNVADDAGDGVNDSETDADGSWHRSVSERARVL